MFQLHIRMLKSHIRIDFFGTRMTRILTDEHGFLFEASVGGKHGLHGMLEAFSKKCIKNATTIISKPKPLHTKASLLAEMENCGKDVESEAEREAMKDSGIGTPATRAAIHYYIMSNKDTYEIKHLQSAGKGEIILYQPDNSLKLEVRLEDETVWLAQVQIAKLFAVDRSVITKHIQNIFFTGELEEDSTCAIFAHMGNNGKQQYRTRY